MVGEITLDSPIFLEQTNKAGLLGSKLNKLFEFICFKVTRYVTMSSEHTNTKPLDSTHH